MCHSGGNDEHLFQFKGLTVIFTYTVYSYSVTLHDVIVYINPFTILTFFLICIQFIMSHV